MLPLLLRNGHKYAPLIPAQQFIEDCSVKVPFSGCWIWMKGINSRGYGVVVIAKKALQAHRVAYEAFNGPLPEGLLACHRCDVKACVNPAHLFLGTDGDNLNDSYSKRRRKMLPVDVVQRIYDWIAAGRGYFL